MTDQQTRDEVIQVARVREANQEIRSMLNTAWRRLSNRGDEAAAKHLHDAVICTHMLDGCLIRAIGED